MKKSILSTKDYEAQRKQLQQIAEDYYGKDYLNKLDDILKLITDEDYKPNYILTVNSEGAFYANEK